MDKPNCYKCIHRGTVPGDAHSCCKHPDFKELNDNPLAGIMFLLGGGRGRTGPIQGDGKVTVKGNPHGIKMGWFMHPVNFDPCWLEECNGFEAKQ